MAYLLEYLKFRRRNGRSSSESSDISASSSMGDDIHIDDNTNATLPSQGTSDRYDLPASKFQGQNKDEQSIQHSPATLRKISGAKKTGLLMKTLTNLSLIANIQSDQLGSTGFNNLFSFIADNNLTGLRTFLDDPLNKVDDRDDNGSTALILAAAQGKAHFCKELIEHGADINARDNDQWTALISAVKEGHSEVVTLLLEKKADISLKDMGGWTPIMWASYKDHGDIAKILLMKGADPNTMGSYHLTSLGWASGRGHTDIVIALLENKAKVNVGDKFGTTPLIWATRKGYYYIAQALLKHGANVDASGMYSWTPLLVAVQGNFVDLVHLLLEFKPHLNSPDKDGRTPLTIACKEGYADIANALLNAGAYVNIQDGDGNSNLIHAARAGHKTVVEALLNKHADVDMFNKDHKTTLYWAVEKGKNAIVKLLLSANPDLEHSTKDGDTSLLRAVRTKNAEIVQLLVDKKARVSHADKSGDTALHIAMRCRSKKIVEILLRNPKNSQLLYRPNRAGETPYNMDLANNNTIMGQIFGARRLNTNEDNENMLGYDLYSSSLADILSEPSLSLPIAVGLYAKWGSGKSFLIRKLKEEMGNFTKQWVDPLFQLSPLVFVLVFQVALLAGLIAAVPSFSWEIGLAIAAGVFILSTCVLLSIWHASRKYNWPQWLKWSIALEENMASMKLVLQVMFCSPPGLQWKNFKQGVQAKPLRFLFGEGAKPSSTAAGESSVVEMLGSLFDKVEQEYGLFATRFYRAFRPKSQRTASPWKYRRLCCMPYIVIFSITLACLLTALTMLSLINLYPEKPISQEPLHLQKRGAFSLIDERDDNGDNKASIESSSEDDDDEDDDDDDDVAVYDQGFHYGLHDFHENYGAIINPVLITLGVLVAIVLIANLQTIARIFSALIFSHRRHLLRSVRKLDNLKAESYLRILKIELNILVDMVQCLDAFKWQQTRLVVMVDGLDSCEQEKVLSVLDAVHGLFSETNAPFIILLAIDPHSITKAIELHVNRVFNESNISGHDYLRNIVHLPFYLQNSGLKKVKQAQLTAEHNGINHQSSWVEEETDPVTLAATSALGGINHIPVSQIWSTENGHQNQKRKFGISINKGVGVNENENTNEKFHPDKKRVSVAQDLTKVLLSDDYFSGINPRSMRRLMNIVYITGRLLKSFHIDFNWYHLASWVNITEQWPYRTSWLILYYEANEGSLEDKLSLMELYEKVTDELPQSHSMTSLISMDKEEKKLELFLSQSSLHISDLKIFLPFTINLDPYIRKLIKEEQPQYDDMNSSTSANTMVPSSVNPWIFPAIESQRKASLASKKNSMSYGIGQKTSVSSVASGHTVPPMHQVVWGYGPPSVQFSPPFTHPIQSNSSGAYDNPAFQLHNNEKKMLHSNEHKILPAAAANVSLSSLKTEEVYDILCEIEGISSSSLSLFKDGLNEHNINGMVLSHCNLDALKKVFNMNFGDWELFRMMVMSLREQESAGTFNL